MSSMIDEPMMAAPLPPVLMPQLRTYNFSVLCNSGAWRAFSCQAQDFVTARRLLDTFKEQN